MLGADWAVAYTGGDPELKVRESISSDSHGLPLVVTHEVAHGVKSQLRSDSAPCKDSPAQWDQLKGPCSNRHEQHAWPWYQEWRSHTLAALIVEDQPNAHDTRAWDLRVAYFLAEPEAPLVEACRPNLLSQLAGECGESSDGLARAYGSALFGLYLDDQFGHEIFHEIERSFVSGESAADAVKVAIDGRPGVNYATVIADFWVAVYLLSNQSAVNPPEYAFTSSHTHHWRDRLGQFRSNQAEGRPMPLWDRAQRWMGNAGPGYVSVSGDRFIDMNGPFHRYFGEGDTHVTIGPGGASFFDVTAREQGLLTVSQYGAVHGSHGSTRVGRIILHPYDGDGRVCVRDGEPQVFNLNETNGWQRNVYLDWQCPHATIVWVNTAFADGRPVQSVGATVRG